jgi:hypothetical protein
MEERNDEVDDERERYGESEKGFHDHDRPSQSIKQAGVDGQAKHQAEPQR